MIYLLTGDNTYQVRQHTERLLQSSHGTPKRLDGDTISLNTLPELMMGMSLFGAPEPLIIRGLSENENVWQKFIEWIPQVNDEQLILLIEPKLDKRTKAYKALVGQVEVVETKQWIDRDHTNAAEWLRTRAKELKISLSPAQVEDMVSRAHVPSEKPGTSMIDQMRLHSALQALGTGTDATDDMIDAVMPKAMGDTIFDLLSIAAEGNKQYVRSVLNELRAREDAHKVFAILASQWVQLVSVAISEGMTADLGIHPYVVQKLSTTARQFSRRELRTLTRLAATIDTGMKRSQFEPWDGVERFVIGIAVRRQLLS